MISSLNSVETGNDSSQNTGETLDLKRILFRVLPYWPLLPVVMGVFLAGAYFYLKYQVPVYQVSARVVVNDGEQEKGTNLFQALSFRNTDKETEREKEILQSKSLIFQVVRNEQLNIRWLKKGRVTTVPQFGNLPLEVWLQNPDSVKHLVIAEVHLVAGNRVEFSGLYYPLDSVVKSPFGNIRWHLNNATQFTNEWELTIMPVKTAVGIFRGQLSAVPISKQSAIIDLSVLENVPARGELFLNALLDEYGRNNVAFKNRVYQNTAKFLEERLSLVSDELNGVESKLENFKSKEGIFNLSTQGEQFLNQLREIDQKEGEAELQLTVLGKIEQYVVGRNHSAEAVPATLGLNDPVLLNLLNQLYQSEFELEKLKKLTGAKNPELAVLEQSLEKLRPSILASIRNLRISLQSTKDKLGVEGKQYAGQLKNIPKKERALLEISRQQQIKNSIYTFLLQKREEAILSAAAQVPNHRVINVPEYSGLVTPKSKMIYLFALSIAITLVIMIIYIKEFSNSKVLFSSDLIKFTNLPLLGELVFSKRFEQDVVIQPSERILIAEQLRDLRTNLSYIKKSKSGAQVLLITSSISGEGKSFLAVNIAAALSRVGKKVLIMECDLRKPAITQKLGIAKGTGLTDYLIGHASEQEILRPVDKMENIFLISSGPIPPNPVELLMNGKFQPLLTSLRNEFDYIIIDAPPVGILTDAKVLAMEADSTLYVVRHNYTPLEFLPFIKDLANRNVLPQINLVFNGIIRKKMPGYGYGYGYSYGYGGGYIKEDDKHKEKLKK